MDRFLIERVHANRRATWRDASIQHSPRKSNFVFAGAASRYHPQALPPFGWDTEPVIGAEVIIEDAFMDVFCDLMYGGGWMETEREEVDRECNWALVSGIALKMRDHRLTCFTLADRIQVASLD